MKLKRKHPIIQAEKDFEFSFAAAMENSSWLGSYASDVDAANATANAALTTLCNLVERLHTKGILSDTDVMEMLHNEFFITD